MKLNLDKLTSVYRNIEHAMDLTAMVSDANRLGEVTKMSHGLMIENIESDLMQALIDLYAFKRKLSGM